MVLDEGDGRLGGLDDIFVGITARGDDVFLLGRALHLFTDDDIRTHPDRQPDDETEHDLAQQFRLPRKPVLVLLDGFDIIVGKAQGAAPEHAEAQKNDIDVRQVCKEQDARQDPAEDDDAPETRGLFLQLLSGRGGIHRPLLFLEFPLSRELSDEPFPEDQGEDDGRDAGKHGAEGQIVHQSHAREVHAGLLKISEKMINHFAISLKVSFTISFSSKGNFCFPIIW